MMKFKKGKLRIYAVIQCAIAVVILCMLNTGCMKDCCNQLNPANRPYLTTDSVTAITQTTATSGGKITYDGGATITARGVCWAKTQLPTIADDTTLDGTGVGHFTSALTGLIPDSAYFVRAYAINSAGVAYGEERILVALSHTGTR